MNYGCSRAAVFLFCAAIVSSHALAQSPATSEDALLSIDSGRLLAMLSQVSTLMKVEEADVPEADTPAAALDAAVSQYNRLRVVACERALVQGPSCSARYAPPTSPNQGSASVLRRQVNDAEAHIRPFWETICQKLDNPAHPVCQME